MRILIATGGSAHSCTAVAVGARLAQRLEAELTLLTVLRTGPRRVNREDTGDALCVPSIVHSSIVRGGRPAEQILAELRESSYDLLVLGERSRHRRRARLFGSVVDKVTAHAPCSTLIVRGAENAFGRVLICDSGRTPPTVIDALLTRGLHQLFAPGADTIVLHVMSQISAGPGVSGRDLAANAQELIGGGSFEGRVLSRDSDILTQLGYGAKVWIRHGFVVDEIVAAAIERDAELIVIGARQYDNWQSKLLADLGRQIVRRLDRSMLVVR